MGAAKVRVADRVKAAVEVRAAAKEAAEVVDKAAAVVKVEEVARDLALVVNALVCHVVNLFRISREFLVIK